METSEIIESYKTQLATLKERQNNHQDMIERNTAQIRRLDDAMSELREKFGAVSTHADILALHNKIDSSINTLLNDALASVPQKAMLWFTGILALLALADLLARTFGGK